MCGITGIYFLDEHRVDPLAIQIMTRLQYHRGPDDFGYVFFDQQGIPIWSGRELRQLPTSGPLAFGHRRLSIIDLLETGRQPMNIDHGRFWITYNGEIYNHIELRQELMAKGHRFFGHCDTEVILRAYQQWGSGCIERFNGMWAFALWDTRNKRLFCSRDRMGIKPFYYYFDGHRFIFASEIKAVLAGIPPEQRQTNEPYLSRFITSGRMNDADETFFKYVKQLPPAHCLQIKENQFHHWRYWDIPPNCISRADQNNTSENEATEQFRHLLADSIRLRFRSDVPVGLSLSGGLDSSSLVALAHRQNLGPLRTFTVEYPEKDFSEGNYPHLVAETFQTDSLFLTPAGHHYIDFIDQFSWYHDEPCPGPGMFSQWYVMKLARSKVKVILVGQGADELLGGYSHYFPYYLLSRIKRAISTNAQNPLPHLFSDFRAIAAHTNTSLPKSTLNLLAPLLHTILPVWLLKQIRFLKHRAARFSLGPGIWDIVNGDIIRQSLSTKLPQPKRFRDDLNNILYWELTRDNLPMLLQYDDRTSMACSLETRLPFLDYRLVEFANSLPYHFKIRSQTSKFLLRRSLQGLLPDEVVNRSDKKGFPTPFAHWIKGVLHDYVQDTINSRSFKNHAIFHPEKVNHLFRQHCRGKFDHSWLLWRILNIERWTQAFFDKFEVTCQDYISKIKPSDG